MDMDMEPQPRKLYRIGGGLRSRLVTRQSGLSGMVEW